MQSYSGRSPVTRRRQPAEYLSFRRASDQDAHPAGASGLWGPRTLLSTPLNQEGPHTGLMSAMVILAMRDPAREARTKRHSL
jgi:hypothetical protein